MSFTTKIVFHNASRSRSVERFVRDRVEKLPRIYRNILGCQVVIDAPHHHHQKGNHYRVRLALYVPGRDLVVGHGHKGSAAHEDIYAAIIDAFAALESQLTTFVGKQRVSTTPHRRHGSRELRPTPLESDSGQDWYGFEYENLMEVNDAGESAIG